MSDHHPYKTGDQVAVTIVGKIDADGDLRFVNVNGRDDWVLEKTFSDSPDIVDHYKIEPSRPQWRDLPSGTVFNFPVATPFVRTDTGVLSATYGFRISDSTVDEWAERSDFLVLWRPGEDRP